MQKKVCKNLWDSVKLQKQKNLSALAKPQQQFKDTHHRFSSVSFQKGLIVVVLDWVKGNRII